MKRPLQPLAPTTEPRTGALDIAGQPRQILTPYLSAREAIEYLRLPSVVALYHLIRDQRLPTLRRGRSYLFDTRELDAWLRGASSSVELTRHSQTVNRARIAS